MPETDVPPLPSPKVSFKAANIPATPNLVYNPINEPVLTKYELNKQFDGMMQAKRASIESTVSLIILSQKIESSH